MLQTMTRVAQWLARDSDSEANVERAMRRSFIGKSRSQYPFTLLINLVGAKLKIQGFRLFNLTFVQWDLL
jgi:hypothetical protein